MDDLHWWNCDHGHPVSQVSPRLSFLICCLAGVGVVILVFGECYGYGLGGTVVLACSAGTVITVIPFLRFALLLFSYAVLFDCCVG